MNDLWITWSPRDYPEDKAHNWNCEPLEMWGYEPVDKVTASVRADALTRRGYGQSYAIPADTVRFTNYDRLPDYASIKATHDAARQVEKATGNNQVFRL